MRYAFLTLILMLPVIKALAYCLSPPIQFWPSAPAIKQNSLILAEGVFGSQNIIQGLNEQYPVYLRSGCEEVKLLVREILVGEKGISQALLAPEKKLTAGKEYHMVIDNLPDDEELARWNPKTESYEPVKWMVQAGTDTELPVWENTPVEKNKWLQFYGNGPECLVNFSFMATDESEFLVRTTVTNIERGRTTTYYLQTGDDKSIPYKRLDDDEEPDGCLILAVGHWMCSGPFDLSEDDKPGSKYREYKFGREFEVTFDLMDASGNLVPWTGEKIRFTTATATTW